MFNIDRDFIELHQAIANSGGVPCSELPEVFFPESADAETKALEIKTAKSYCSDCPLVAPCLAYALKAGMHGIWGGTTYEERQTMAGRSGR